MAKSMRVDAGEVNDQFGRELKIILTSIRLEYKYNRTYAKGRAHMIIDLLWAAGELPDALADCYLALDCEEAREMGLEIEEL